ncbi:transglycosylase SLT domain-containing protein [Streptomyces lunaelactis]|uniref:aggregation-promoting factor C-terminal-like domain-containing protein n=1 Tax=Streptomyces lunaelactis TaxID=1535768 RepID=UPI0015859CA2|nr:transglycosylase SLT domain-containing protein [Streptomyces lunaelactis]NUK00649.1 transglycosylase SLT domain-containing protein [Streptomyces lunaelactis]NUK08055.1 transglycosylase SLT domain-containing protein [Streptomyces lunaelactis]NUK14495.1 transglycosylase SLT domain-containing protein [Streptomyces lunaelactis]NUK21517.1 transglycosylase SLT domain-containing protein [Streptomyces lunaelactis]NUK33530.1 transglycosylase SLT domain-containing protein [Streptomyces lunaelactis]
MSRISVRGFAVASATAVTTVGAVVGVASGNTLPAGDDLEAAAADATLLADIPMGQQAQVQVSSLTQQADAQAAAADAAAKKSAEEAARISAAKTAEAKKEAAEDEAEREREAEEARANRDAVRDASSFSAQGSYTVAEVKAIARQMVPADQFQCFSNIVDHESTWNYRAQNPSSGAYGLVQALPGSKMSSAGDDWQTNPATQIKWGLNYMNSRYDSPCGAWSFWQANHWY